MSALASSGRRRANVLIVDVPTYDGRDYLLLPVSQLMALDVDGTEFYAGRPNGMMGVASGGTTRR